MKIKIGQIYKMKNILPRYSSKYFCTVVVSSIYDDVFTFIYSDGSAGEYSFEKYNLEDNILTIDKGRLTLTAEYPTWQEAVNSKEFNDD